jgi:leader peptidase (prepilin peptidase)/N-methyltransferase
MTLPHPLWLVLAAPFVGSFLATAALRLPAGRPIVLARSACPACGRRLEAREMVPLLSWVASRGRCRTCGAAIDPIHPLVEALAVVVALWAWLALEPPLAWAGTGLGWALLAAAAADVRHRVLPDAIVLPLAVAGLAATWAFDASAALDHVVGAAVGGFAFLAIREAYRALRRREGLGLGDVKLAAAAGAWVGWAPLPDVVLIAALGGLIIALVRWLGGAPLDRYARLPFGPFLCLGIWLVWLHGPFLSAG